MTISISNLIVSVSLYAQKHFFDFIKSEREYHISQVVDSTLYDKCLHWETYNHLHHMNFSKSILLLLLLSLLCIEVYAQQLGIDVDEQGFPLGITENLTNNTSLSSTMVSDSEAILPNFFADQLGGASNAIPFGFGGRQTRYQQLFLGSEVGANRVITSLCFRLNTVFDLTGGTADILVKLGTSDRGLQDLSSTFDDNFLTPPVQVYSGPISFPDVILGTTPLNVNSFDACIEFDTPYEFTSDNLVIEIQVANALPFYFVDGCNPCNTTRVFDSGGVNNPVGSVGSNVGLIMKFGFAPSAATVPTLSEWALLCTGILLLIFGVLTLKEQSTRVKLTDE